MSEDPLGDGPMSDQSDETGAAHINRVTEHPERGILANGPGGGFQGPFKFGGFLFMRGAHDVASVSSSGSAASGRSSPIHRW